MAKDKHDDETPAERKARLSETPEPSPKVAPLVLERGPDGKPLEQPPEAPLAAAGPLPRTVHQNERAPEGTLRVKVRADALADVTAAPPTRYILVAKTDDAEKKAKEFYLKSTGIQARLDNYKDAGMPADQLAKMTPFVIAKVLPD